MAGENPQVMLDNSISGDSLPFVVYGIQQRLVVSVQESDAEGGEVIMELRPGATVKIVRSGDTVQLKKKDPFGNFVPLPTGVTTPESGIFDATTGSHVTAQLFAEVMTST